MTYLQDFYGFFMTSLSHSYKKNLIGCVRN